MRSSASLVRLKSFVESWKKVYESDGG